MTIKVEVFSSPGCGKCGQAKTVLKKTVEEIGNNRIKWCEVNILEELDYAVSHGVMTTPAIASDLRERHESGREKRVKDIY